MALTLMFMVWAAALACVYKIGKINRRLDARCSCVEFDELVDSRLQFEGGAAIGALMCVVASTSWGCLAAASIFFLWIYRGKPAHVV